MNNVSPMDNRTYIYKPSAKPTIWNRDTVLGFMIGSVIIGPITGIVGALIGGYSGKSRLRSDMQNGKAVSPRASFWNKDTFIGFGAGMWAAVLIFSIAVLAVGGPGAVSALFVSGTIPATMTAAAAGITLITAIGAAIAGPIIGGYSGIKRQKNEYQTAKEWVMKNGGRDYHPLQEYEKHQTISQTPARAHDQSAYMPMQHEYSHTLMPSQPAVKNEVSYQNSVPKDSWQAAKTRMEAKKQEKPKAQQMVERQEEHMAATDAQLER